MPDTVLVSYQEHSDERNRQSCALVDLESGD